MTVKRPYRRSVCLVIGGGSVNLVTLRSMQCGHNSFTVLSFTAFVPSTTAVRTYMIIRPNVNAILQTVFVFYEARKSVACCQVPAPLGRPGPKLTTQVPGPLLCKEQCRLTELEPQMFTIIFVALVCVATWMDLYQGNKLRAMKPPPELQFSRRAIRREEATSHGSQRTALTWDTDCSFQSICMFWTHTSHIMHSVVLTLCKSHCANSCRWPLQYFESFDIQNQVWPCAAYFNIVSVV